MSCTRPIGLRLILGPSLPVTFTLRRIDTLIASPTASKRYRRYSKAAEEEGHPGKTWKRDMEQDNGLLVQFTHLVWSHRPENPPGRPRARLIPPRRSPSLFPLFHSKKNPKSIDAGSTNCPLIHLTPSIDYSMREK